MSRIQSNVYSTWNQRHPSPGPRSCCVSSPRTFHFLSPILSLAPKSNEGSKSKSVGHWCLGVYFFLTVFIWLRCDGGYKITMDEVTKPDAHPAVRRPDCVWGKLFKMCILPSRFVAQVLPLGCKYFLWVEFHLWSSKVHPGGLWTACPQVGQVVLWPGHEQGWGGALAESGVSLSCHSTWWPVAQLSLALVLLLIGDARVWGSFAHQWSELQGDPVSEWEWVSAIPDEWTPQSLSFLIISKCISLLVCLVWLMQTEDYRMRLMLLVCVALHWQTEEEGGLSMSSLVYSSPKGQRQELTDSSVSVQSFCSPCISVLCLLKPVMSAWMNYL